MFRNWVCGAPKFRFEHLNRTFGLAQSEARKSFYFFKLVERFPSNILMYRIVIVDLHSRPVVINDWPLACVDKNMNYFSYVVKLHLIFEKKRTNRESSQFDWTEPNQNTPYRALLSAHFTRNWNSVSPFIWKSMWNGFWWIFRWWTEASQWAERMTRDRKVSGSKLACAIWFFP